MITLIFNSRQWIALMSVLVSHEHPGGSAVHQNPVLLQREKDLSTAYWQSPRQIDYTHCVLFGFP